MTKQDGGEGVQHIDNAHQMCVGTPAEVAREAAVERPMTRLINGAIRATASDTRAPVHDAAEHVTPNVVCAEQDSPC